LHSRTKQRLLIITQEARMEKTKKELLKLIRTGIRLNTKAPKTETPKTVYSRKAKFKRRFSDDTSFFIYMRFDFQ
jgi:hypothetical protein